MNEVFNFYIYNILGAIYMKILIFTATTGDGHNQAARNLKYELEKDGIEVKVVDLFKGNTKKSFTSSFFDKGQTFLVKSHKHIL